MDTSDNPWAEALSQPQDKSTTNVIAYCTRQAELLSEATEGKIAGVFAKTREVNKQISTSIDLTAPMLALADAPYLHRTPQLDLRDANAVYVKQDYCFEIRSDTYRFRLFTLVFGPLYPATLHVDAGVCEDLAKLNGRFSVAEDGEAFPISIEDDDDLDGIFRLLLKSRKLNYICNRLMAEAKEGAGGE